MSFSLSMVNVSWRYIQKLFVQVWSSDYLPKLMAIKHLCTMHTKYFEKWLITILFFSFYWLPFYSVFFNFFFDVCTFLFQATVIWISINIANMCTCAQCLKKHTSVGSSMVDQIRKMGMGGNHWNYGQSINGVMEWEIIFISTYFNF